MNQPSKTAAQERADQINAFQRELALLVQDQVLTLEPEQQHSIDDYHQNRLSQYQHAFDIDRSQQEKQRSVSELNSFNIREILTLTPLIRLFLSLR